MMMMMSGWQHRRQSGGGGEREGEGEGEGIGAAAGYSLFAGEVLISVMMT